MGRLVVKLQELVIGSGTAQALAEASKEEEYQYMEAVHRIFKWEAFRNTSETTLLRDAYYAARQARFDRRDPPLTPQEKTIRVKSEWERILMDLQSKGKNEIATYFGLLNVVGFTGNTLELVLSEKSLELSPEVH